MKKLTENLELDRGRKLRIEKRLTRKGLALDFVLSSRKKCMLHWGVCREQRQTWQLPPESCWPSSTAAVSLEAVQSPFVSKKDESRVRIEFGPERNFSFLAFVLYFPEEDCWDNRGGKNYFIRLPRAGGSLLAPGQALEQEVKGREVLFQQVFPVDGHELAAAVFKEGKQFQITLLTDIATPLVLHWGVAESSVYEWLLPTDAQQPAGSTVDGGAAQSPFMLAKGLNRLRLNWPEDGAGVGLNFVLFRPDSGKWFKSGQGNFFIHSLPLRRKQTSSAAIDRAISSGDSAPIGNPMGAKRSSSLSEGMPFLKSNSSTNRTLRRLPISPT